MVAPIVGGVVLSAPTAVAVDRMGNVFIADTGHDRIAEIDTSSNGDVLYTGSVTLSGPLGVALDVFGTVYIADTGDSQGLAVDPSVNADLVAGDPTYSLNRTAVGFGHVQLGSSTAVTLTLPFTTALGRSGGRRGIDRRPTEPGLYLGDGYNLQRLDGREHLLLGGSDVPAHGSGPAQWRGGAL